MERTRQNMMMKQKKSRVDVGGYISILVEDRGWVFEHRLVMEEHLGRPLKPDEVVHHLDGNVTNNQLENLQLITVPEHRQVHERVRSFRPRELADYLVSKADLVPAYDEGGKLYIYDRQGRYRVHDDFDELAGMPCIVKDHLYCFESEGEFAVTPGLVKAVIVRLTDLYGEPLWERPAPQGINLMNGIFNLKEQRLVSHSPEYLSQVQLPVIYEATAECPAWERFVRDTLPADVLEAGVPWQVAGWLMMPHTGLQKALLLFGPGASGKSTFLEGLRAFLGGNNVSAEPLERLEGNRFALANLVGRLANICGDLSYGRAEKSNIFKSIVGEDTLTAERKFEGAFTFKPYARLVFSANSHPRTRDTGDAYYRRWIVLPFPNVIPEEKRDQHLIKKLTEPRELSGLLNKALAALPQVLERGITETQSMKDELEELRLTNQPVLGFLGETLVEDPDGFVLKAEVFSAVQDYCRESHTFTPSEAEIGKMVKREFPSARDHRPRHDGKRTNAWKGITMPSRNDFEPI